MATLSNGSPQHLQRNRGLINYTLIHVLYRGIRPAIGTAELIPTQATTGIIPGLPGRSLRVPLFNPGIMVIIAEKNQDMRTHLWSTALLRIPMKTGLMRSVSTPGDP